MRLVAPGASTLDLVLLMKVSILSTFSFAEHGVPVPRGCLAAVGEVRRRGVVWGPHHQPVVFWP